MKHLIKLSALALCVVLIGCGGGGGGGGDRGALSITINWPQATRLIPVASNSIKIVLTTNGQQVGRRIVARSKPDAYADTVLFPDLPTGVITVTATAYPNADGTGTAQANGSVVVTVPAGQTVNTALAMASTITHVQVSPPNPAVRPDYHPRGDQPAQCHLSAAGRHAARGLSSHYHLHRTYPRGDRGGPAFPHRRRGDRLGTRPARQRWGAHSVCVSGGRSLPG